MLFKSIISAALFAVATVAQSIQFTSTPTSVQVGTNYVITWQGGDSSAPATIILRKGPSKDLATVGTLTSNAVGGSFSWSPDKSLADGTDYAFYIVQGTENNYSLQFTLTGGSAAVASISSAGAAVTSVVSSLASSASAASSNSSASSVSSSSVSASSASASSSSASASSAAASSSSASATKSASSTKPSGTSTAVPASGASGLQSPIAFILCAVAAMLYLN